jgi:hypothetical protein
VLLALFLWEATLLTLTNKHYDGPSSKRAYDLIPLNIFFALLPAYVVYAWCASRRWLRRAAVVLVVAALTVYAGANLQLIISPAPGVYGFNVFDGLIEMRQRFADRHVFLLVSRPESLALADPTRLTQVAYRVADQLTTDPTFAETTIERACEQRALVCYEAVIASDRERMRPLLDKYQGRLVRLPLLNSTQMYCYECVPAPVAGPAQAH